MVCPKTDIEIIRGNTATKTINFFNSNGTALDITGSTIYFTVKKNSTDADVEAVILKTILPGELTDPTNGKTNVDFTTADTTIDVGNYIYELTRIDTSPIRQTVIIGNFIILKNIKDI